MTRASARWVILLRGLNVGRSNRIDMARLRSVVEAAGGRDVQTYVQSGNVVATPPDAATPEAWATAIETGLSELVNGPVTAFVLTAEDLAAAIASNPFPDAIHEPGRLHAFFLSDRPEDDASRALSALARPSERIACVGSVLYLHAPEGIGRSKLAAAVERKLGLVATARNWRTIEALHAKIAS